MIEKYKTSEGAQIYQLPLELFPGFDGYAYLVIVDDYRVLIDTGSGVGRSNEDLENGLREAGEQAGFSSPFRFDDLTHILITHAHIDHFGGLPYICPQTHARLGVHELDRRILTNYEERLSLVGRRMDEFLHEAGTTNDQRTRLMQMYMMTKGLFHSVPVDFTFEACGMRLGPFKMLHVPGHCAGQVVIQLHDILFSGDHVLHDISPHQAPEHLTLSTGIDHYLKSLDLLDSWAQGVRLTLGGHKAPITDLSKRIAEIRQLHQERLDKVLNILRQPKTTSQVSVDLFGDVRGYNELLAIEEAGAHVEYLYQRGLLEIENLEELEKSTNTTPIYYRCADCD